MSKIEISLLGGFEIRADGKPVLTELNQSRRALALIQYLLLQRGERVSHQALTNALWANERTANPDMALRAILHRFRRMVNDEGLDCLRGCVVTARGSYAWNQMLDCTVDIYEVADLSKEASHETDSARRAALNARIVSLYKGRLLPAFAAEPWVESRSVRLHGLYRTALTELLEHEKFIGETGRVIELCRRAIGFDPYEERLYLELILALQRQGQRDAAQAVMNEGLERGCLHHAGKLSGVTADYMKVRRAERTTEIDLARLAEELGTGLDAPGARLYPPDTFREIYHFACSDQSRFGTPVILALLTVSPAPDDTVAETAAHMELLGQILQRSLRQNDAAALYGDTQYAVLFSGGTAETDVNPLERVKTAFYRDPAHGGCVLSYSLCAPDIKPSPYRRAAPPAEKA